MKYVSLFIPLLLFYILSNAQIEKNNIFISGVVKNFNNQVNIEDISENGELELQASERSFLPDSNGRFSISFHLKRATYFRIGRNIVYLSPGISMIATIDYNWPDSANFKGGNYVENMFLKSTPFTFAGSFLEGGDSVKNSLEETVQVILQSSQRRLIKLNNLKRIDSEFRLLEKARIKADIINSLHYLNFYYPNAHGLKGDTLGVYQKKYADFVIPYIKRTSKLFLKDKFLKLEVYRNILGLVMKCDIYSPKDLSIISDWIEAKKIAYAIKSINEKQNIDKFQSKIKSIKTEQYRASLSSTFNKFLMFNGDNAIDFVMMDSSGTVFHLSNFKGKVIYLELWATWCGPCLEQKPFMDSLIHYFSKNSDVAIVSLSIDGDKGAWLKRLHTYQYQGIQFITDRLKLESYYVSEIPRIIIIDKEFKIAAMRGPKPSDDDTKTIIGKLLNK